MPLEAISHYDLLKKIASGPEAELYRARDNTSGREVAIKVFSRDEVLGAARLRQIKQASTLIHPSFPQIYAVSEDERKPYVVMEYVEGVTLQDLIASGRSSSLDINNIALQLAQGLNAAHSVGIIHRDVKPANIVISPKGVVRILDFGLARITDPGTGDENVIAGTPAYMAPEVFLGQSVDQRSDIFSFGVTLYELSTGEMFRREFPPVSFELDKELINRVTEAPISNQLKTIILRSIKTNPHERYQSFADVIRDLSFDRVLQGVPSLTVACSAAPTHTMMGNWFAFSGIEGLNFRSLFALAALIVTLATALGGLILCGGTSLGFAMAFGGGVLAYESYILLRAVRANSE